MRQRSEIDPCLMRYWWVRWNCSHCLNWDSSSLNTEALFQTLRGYHNGVSSRVHMSFSRRQVSLLTTARLESRTFWAWISSNTSLTTITEADLWHPLIVQRWVWISLPVHFFLYNFCPRPINRAGAIQCLLPSAAFKRPPKKPQTHSSFIYFCCFESEREIPKVYAQSPLYSYLDRRRQLWR